jgi:hypothetical protein
LNDFDERQFASLDQKQTRQALFEAPAGPSSAQTAVQAAADNPQVPEM